MFASPGTKGPERLERVERLTAWTRERFGLRGDSVVSVSEIACAAPGCPPVETAVMFWTADGRHYHFKVFKPLADVVADDLPPAWYMDALAVAQGVECDCC